MKKTERVFGMHAVGSLLKRDPARVSVLLALETRSDARMAEVLGLAEKANVPVRRVSRRELDELVAGVSHQGVVAETGVSAGLGEKELPAFLQALPRPAFLLVLDGVQDPQNQFENRAEQLEEHSAHDQGEEYEATVGRNRPDVAVT